MLAVIERFQIHTATPQALSQQTVDFAYVKRFPFYLGVTLVTFSFYWLFLILGFPFVTIYANHVLLATFVTMAGLFSGGFGLILVAKISGKGVGTNTPRTWFIVNAIVAVGVAFSVAIVSAYGPLPRTPRTTVVLTSCSGDPKVCTVALSNVESADDQTTSNCSLTFGGTTHSATSTVQTIKAGGPEVLVTCTASAATAPCCYQVSGQIQTAGGETILFDFPVIA